MAGRFYSEETEEQERARKRNERRRAFSSMFINGAIALIAAGVSVVGSDPLHAIEWFLIACGLISGALWWLEQTEAEY